MAIDPPQHPSSSTQHTLLIATVDEDRRRFLAGQLDADGHTIHEADHQAAVIAKLSAHAIDVLILGDLERPADAPGLLRSVRAGEQSRVHPALPVITLGADDELTLNTVAMPDLLTRPGRTSAPDRPRRACAPGS
jgi:CheY-like chemotaxis protein